MTGSHPERPHALTLGATGMLSQTVRGLTERGWQVSVLARHPERITYSHCHPFVCDWSEPDRADQSVARAVEEASAALDPPGLVLCWTHRSAQALALARVLASPALPISLEKPVPFFHVLGSGTRDPARPDYLIDLGKRFEAIGGFAWRAIVLGFVIEDWGSRWLTHEEISTGTLAAIDQGADGFGTDECYQIGTVRPWSARPAGGA